MVVVALGDLGPIVLLSMAQRNAHCCGAVCVSTSESALPSVRVLQTRGRRELPSSRQVFAVASRWGQWRLSIEQEVTSGLVCGIALAQRSLLLCYDCQQWPRAVVDL